MKKENLLLLWLATSSWSCAPLPNPESGVQLCSPASLCADGYYCAENKCWKVSEGPGDGSGHSDGSASYPVFDGRKDNGPDGADDPTSVGMSEAEVTAASPKVDGGTYDTSPREPIDGALEVGDSGIGGGTFDSGTGGAADGSGTTSYGWSALGSGMNQPVVALVVDSSGILYAGGYFLSAGGISARHVARWNGAAWSPLGVGTDDPVYALAVDAAGNLYAAGEGPFPNHVAKWNGSSWSDLGSGMDGIVKTLAVDSSGSVYAGGYIVVAGKTRASVTKWNGTAWAALGAGGKGALGDSVNESSVVSLAVDSLGKLYAAGSFSTAGAVSANHVAKWDGAAWSALGSGVDGTMYKVTIDPWGTPYVSAGVAALGWYVVKWNGYSWVTVGATFDSVVFDMAFDSVGSLFVGGMFETAGGVAAKGVARWNGTSWVALGSGMVDGNMRGYVAALGFDSRGYLYAGGQFATAGEIQANGVAVLPR